MSIVPYTYEAAAHRHTDYYGSLPTKGDGSLKVYPKPPLSHSNPDTYPHPHPHPHPYPLRLSPSAIPAPTATPAPQISSSIHDPPSSPPRQPKTYHGPHTARFQPTNPPSPQYCTGYEGVFQTSTSSTLLGNHTLWPVYEEEEEEEEDAI
ncbi:uncharacterized protein PADG_02182 [Paracoccidioides brasiliensis Pb18]|uniref:Uncharacterized protein n=1 Tax=Paracoccidioides brasiliensis (strain Pb18) TaxID=502780 RepID=C1G216_PARBD|nr:uncharacterized protein PADG_02182 [Paracoccidioides brasiliensis Pb18]EEH46032.2 hypothetical protein PADG_02182 [Paracoccidioides brasiliensis Pb18]